MTSSEFWYSAENLEAASSHIDSLAKICRRTLKYLLGVLHGKWILQTSWLKAWLQGSGPVDEETHEVTADSAGQGCGPILGRMHAELKLLQNWEVRKDDRA